MPNLSTLDMLYAEWLDLQIRYLDAIAFPPAPSEEISSLRLAAKRAWNEYEDAQDRI